MPPSKTQKAKKAKKTKTSKSKTSSTKAQVTAPVAVAETTPAVAPAVASAASSEQEPATPTLDDDFRSMLAHIVELKSNLSAVISEFRRLQKRAIREIKEAARQGKKRRRTPANGKRAPSGFAKPGDISPELCDFMDKPHGTKMARTEVTKFLTQYIKSNNLQDQSNKRRILCNDELATLLSVTPEVEVTYFNLQKFMKPHFPKSATSS